MAISRWASAAEMEKHIINATPYVDTTTGNWFRWNEAADEYENTGIPARGPRGFAGPYYNDVIVSTNEPTLGATFTYDPTKASSALIVGDTFNVAMKWTDGQNWVHSYSVNATLTADTQATVVSINETTGTRGPQGDEGPQGDQGVQGPAFTVKGHYPTYADLLANVPSPTVGDTYTVGAGTEEDPNILYMYLAQPQGWKNYGAFNAGGGNMLKSDYDTNNNMAADKADALTTARTIALSGDATGSASFDGSANVTIAVTVNEIQEVTF